MPKGRHEFGYCSKCGTKVLEVRELDDRLLGVPCGCYAEEVEKQDPKIEQDQLDLEEYRTLCAGTNGQTPTTIDD